MASRKSRRTSWRLNHSFPPAEAASGLVASHSGVSAAAAGEAPKSEVASLSRSRARPRESRWRFEWILPPTTQALTWIPWIARREAWAHASMRAACLLWV